MKRPKTLYIWSSWEWKATNAWAKIGIQITYHSAFQNFRSKENIKVFGGVLDTGCRNGKNLKDYLVRAILPKLNESGRCEKCGKKTCLVCNSISSANTFATEA